MATKQFQVELYQSHWQRSKTEVFSVEAETKEEAAKAAEKLVTEKNITENYDLVVVDNTIEPVL